MGWLALAAVGLATLAPGVSRALAADATPGSPFAAVCRIDAGPGTGPGSSQPLQALAHLLDHCALCAGCGADAAAPPPAITGYGVADVRHVGPATQLPAGDNGSCCAPAQARAPPTRS